MSVFSWSLASGVGWSVLTLLVYLLCKKVHHRLPRWWATPLILAPLILSLITSLSGLPYADYRRATGWLVTLLGPATVAFAIPVYNQRALIRRYWPILLLATLCGSLLSVASSWAMVYLLGLDDELLYSLLPHSISTPFAMAVSQQIGGSPSLAAVFVIVTGLLAVALGDLLLARACFRSPLARGLSYGVAGHAIGTSKARQLGETEGAISGMVMVMMGVLNLVVICLLQALV